MEKDLFPPVGQREETVLPGETFCEPGVALLVEERHPSCYKKPMSRADEIRFYSEELAKRFRPQKIVLFGSHASRSATKDSDVDMLVVMRHKGPAATQAARIRQQVRAPFALDLIVRSPGVLQRRLKLGDSFLKAVMNEGKVLYESAG